MVIPKSFIAWTNSSVLNVINPPNIATSNPLFKTKLKDKNFNFVEEYTPLKDRFYSVDISFPSIRIGLEINGNQHYNSDGSLKKYYKQRKIDIENEGWKLYNIYYTKVYDDCFCDELINDLKNKHNLDNIDLSFNMVEKKINKCIDCEKEIYNLSIRCKKCSSKNNSIKRRIVNRPDYEELKNLVFENGYSATGRKYGVSDNAIRKWFKFYEAP